MNLICTFRNENVKTPALPKKEKDYSKLPFGVQAYDGDVDVFFKLSYTSTYDMPVVYYSFDASNWTLWSDIFNDHITVESGNTLYLYGEKTNCWCNANYIGSNGLLNISAAFTTTNNGKVKLVGQFSSLVNPDWTTPIALPNNGGKLSSGVSMFFSFFKSNNLIYDASNMHINFTACNYVAYGYMFDYCSNMLYGPKWDGLSTSANASAISLYDHCTNLVEAELPGFTTNGGRDFETAFRNCTSLNKVTYRGTTTLNYSGMTTSVPSTGDFYNLGGASYSTGASGIPSGWTIHTSLDA